VTNGNIDCTLKIHIGFVMNYADSNVMVTQKYRISQVGNRPSGSNIIHLMLFLFLFSGNKFYVLKVD